MKLNECFVKSTGINSIEEILREYNYEVKVLSETVLWIRQDCEAIFIELNGSQLYFQKDFGELEKTSSPELLFSLLDLNTEIVPIAVGIDTTGGQSRLVLVDSIEASYLDKAELLSVLDSLEHAEEQVVAILNKHYNA